MSLRKTEKQRPASLAALGTFSVPGTRVGAIISLGLVIVAWLAIPLARPFIIGTVAFGAIFAVILRRTHKG